MCKKLFFVSALFISICSIHAQLNISYQPYELDELVIDTDGYKMTAKALDTYGMKATKVTIANTGETEETIALDTQSLSCGDVYKRLSYSTIAAGSKGVLVTLLVWISLIGCTYDRKWFNDWLAIMTDDDNKIPQDVYDKVYKLSDKYILDKKKSHPYKMGTLNFLFHGLYLPVPWFLYRTYSLNSQLHAFLTEHLCTDSVRVEPGAIVTKIVITNRDSVTQLT